MKKIEESDYTAKEELFVLTNLLDLLVDRINEIIEVLNENNIK